MCIIHICICMHVYMHAYVYIQGGVSKLDVVTDLLTELHIRKGDTANDKKLADSGDNDTIKSLLDLFVAQKFVEKSKTNVSGKVRCYCTCVYV